MSLYNTLLDLDFIWILDGHNLDTGDLSVNFRSNKGRSINFNARPNQSQSNCLSPTLSDFIWTDFILADFILDGL